MSAEELIRACAELNDGSAWQEFVARYERPISLSLQRAVYQWGEIPQQVVEDLVQETYLKLCGDNCRLLLDFAMRHPEATTGYVKTIAINVAHDHFKSLYSHKRGRGETAQLLEDIEPSAQGGSFGSADRMEREVLLKEINLCLLTCATGPDHDRDCTIFWLYYQQGMSASTIAELPSVNLTMKGVESVIFRLTRLVREHLVSLRSQPSSAPITKAKGFRPAESY
jgi:RNA polymerase sigma-70 factor, ECF subfamily